MYAVQRAKVHLGRCTIRVAIAKNFASGEYTPPKIEKDVPQAPGGQTTISICANADRATPRCIGASIRDKRESFGARLSAVHEVMAAGPRARRGSPVAAGTFLKREGRRVGCEASSWPSTARHEPGLL